MHPSFHEGTSAMCHISVYTRSKQKQKFSSSVQNDRTLSHGSTFFDCMIIGEHPLSDRRRSAIVTSTATPTRSSFKLSPRVSWPVGRPNKTNTFLMDRGQTGAPCDTACTVLGRVHACLCAPASYSSDHRCVWGWRTKIYRESGNEFADWIESHAFATRLSR